MTRLFCVILQINKAYTLSNHKFLLPLQHIYIIQLNYNHEKIAFPSRFGGTF